MAQRAIKFSLDNTALSGLNFNMLNGASVSLVPGESRTILFAEGTKVNIPRLSSYYGGYGSLGLKFEFMGFDKPTEAKTPATQESVIPVGCVPEAIDPGPKVQATDTSQEDVIVDENIDETIDEIDPDEDEIEDDLTKVNDIPENPSTVPSSEVTTFDTAAASFEELQKFAEANGIVVTGQRSKKNFAETINKFLAGDTTE